jgi:hypothetical protein
MRIASATRTRSPFDIIIRVMPPPYDSAHPIEADGIAAISSMIRKSPQLHDPGRSPGAFRQKTQLHEELGSVSGITLVLRRLRDGGGAFYRRADLGVGRLVSVQLFLAFFGFASASHGV